MITARLEIALPRDRLWEVEANLRAALSRCEVTILHWEPDDSSPPVECLPIPTQAITALINERIRSAAVLVSRPQMTIWRITGIGPQYFRCIVQELAFKGYFFHDAGTDRPQELIELLGLRVDTYRRLKRRDIHLVVQLRRLCLESAWLKPGDVRNIQAVLMAVDEYEERQRALDPAKVGLVIFVLMQRRALQRSG